MVNIICRHSCKDCYALRVCALNAIKDQQGAIYVETDSCIGCGACKTACTAFGLKALEDKTPEWLMGTSSRLS
ncbi:MAG TPA: 4Fe-4S binding protein [Desulfatiglandales bacterium]|nr:4Fe-4S binding protein [Desulfatiglandales bacterium]